MLVQRREEGAYPEFKLRTENSMSLFELHRCLPSHHISLNLNFFTYFPHRGPSLQQDSVPLEKQLVLQNPASGLPIYADSEIQLS